MEESIAKELVLQRVWKKGKSKRRWKDNRGYSPQMTSLRSIPNVPRPYIVQV
jgi:hypothetical protein